MSGVEVRKVEREYGETGLGQSNRIEVAYELGAEVDGTWVAFAKVGQVAVDAAKAKADAAKSNEPASQPAAEPPTTAQPTEQPADEQHAI